MDFESMELEGLSVTLDKLDYHFGGENTSPDTPHVFVYFLTIENNSDRWVKFLGRKWVITNKEDGDRLIVEGDKIVGEEPELSPGERFSYNSFHLSPGEASAVGSFHGVDQFDQRIHVAIPSFDMKPPNHQN